MPDLSRVITYIFRGKNETSAAAKAAEREFQGVARAAQAAERDARSAVAAAGRAGGGSAAAAGAGTSRSLIDSLNEVGGRGSDLGKLGKLLAGGGAVFALSKITSEFAHLAEGAEKFTTAMRMGEESGGKLADSFARSLPILGNIYAAGRSIREIFTAEAVEASLITKYAEDQNRAIEFRNTLLEKEKKHRSDIANYIRESQFQVAKMGMPDSAAREAERLHSQQERRDKLLADEAAHRKEIADPIAKRRNEIIAQLSRAQASLPEEHDKIDRYVTNPITTRADDKIRAAKLAEITLLQREYASLGKANQASEKESQASRSALIAQDAIQSAAERKRWMDDDRKSAAADAEKAERSIAGVRAAARADEFKMLGRDLDAERVLRQQKLDEQLADIRDEQRKRLAEHPDDANTIRRQADEAQKAARLEARRDEELAAKKDRDEQQRKTDETAKKKQEDADKAYRETDRKLEALNRAQKNLDDDVPEFKRSSGLAKTDTDSHLTGVADRSKQRKTQDQVLEEQKKHTKHLQHLEEYTRALLALSSRERVVI